MMKRLLIVSPYYNNSHFIPIQAHSFNKHIKNCTWSLLALDDSKESSINILTGVQENIQRVCADLSDSILYEKIPQKIHNGSSDGFQRHQTVMNYFFRNLLAKYSSFDYLLFYDADMCFIKDMDIGELMSDCDITGPKRVQWLGNRQCSPDFKRFNYLWVHCSFFNIKTIPNLNEINMNVIPGTSCDTGSMMVKFLLDNPHYRVKYQEMSTGFEMIEGLDFEFFYNNSIIHFGSGSLWNNYIGRERYITKLEDFTRLVHGGLSDNDKELILSANTEKWYPKRHYQSNHPSPYCTEDDIRAYLRMYGIH